MEQIVIVDEKGIIKRFSSKKDLLEGEITAVELVVVYLPGEKKVVLFNRGHGASDMHNHWALEAGKVILEDLSESDGDSIGRKLSLCAYKNAAIRELNEELNFPVSPDDLQVIDEFYMVNKRIYFTLLSLALAEAEFKKLSPDQSEVDKIKRFTLEEFKNNPHLGDAIMFRKDKIIQYLQRVLGESV